MRPVSYYEKSMTVRAERIRELLPSLTPDILLDYFVDQKEDWGSPEGPYFCFCGAQYIASLFVNDRIVTDRKLIKEEDGSFDTVVTDRTVTERDDSQFGRDKYLTSIRIDDIKSLPTGIYYAELHTNLEGHAFVMYMSDDKLVLYNSYGGNIGFYSVTASKGAWVEKLKNLLGRPIDKEYVGLWGFPVSWMGHTLGKIPYFEKLVINRVR